MYVLHLRHFEAVELNLYLDTHPDDPTALEQYNRTCSEIRQLEERYDQECTPLMNHGHAPSPFPWQWSAADFPNDGVARGYTVPPDLPDLARSLRRR